MIASFIYIILAALGLGFLIFIHELGHYYMARKLGMRVEAFGIGFGKPIFTWTRNGVKWHICWLPFGGYVKIAGMEKEGDLEPYEISDGFFGKKPLDRIKVAFMGPFVNILFALLVFVCLWATGGREKKFSDFTHRIGWVDPKSELFAKGLRPGDTITQYAHHDYQGVKDHLYAPMTSGSQIEVQGMHIDDETSEAAPFDYTVRIYPHPSAIQKGIVTAGILNSANYLIYLPTQSVESSLPEGSPMRESNIQPGDRIVWVDGVIMHSLTQLSHVINDGRALLTVKRGDQTLLMRIPRIKVQELKLDSQLKEELIDWQFEAQLNGSKIGSLYTIPYNMTPDALIEQPLKFIDKENEEDAFSTHPMSALEMPLQKGDKIIAVDGTPIEHAFQLLAQLQQRHVLIVVERGYTFNPSTSWTEADADYNHDIQWSDLEQITQSIGSPHQQNAIGHLHLLIPVVPKTRSEFTLSPEKQALLNTELVHEKKEIEAIEDPEKKAHALQLLNQREKQLMLGLPDIQDRKVSYNPNPLQLFSNVFQEIWYTLSALLSGYLNPKWISGPIGIVQVVHDNWMIGVKEALFWLGAISLNLGILNLLPIPVLDGGYICFSLYEMLTGQRLKTKTLEKFIIPFAVLLIGFLIYLTYNDLMRLLGNFLS